MRAIEKLSLLALCITLAVFLTPSGYGQAVYGSIFGTVTDASGAAVPNATVTITNIGTGTYVDLSGGSTIDGTKIQGWSNALSGDYQKNQCWRFEKDDNVPNAWKITNANGVLCMTLSRNGSNADGTPIEGWQYDASRRSSKWVYLKTVQPRSLYDFSGS